MGSAPSIRPPAPDGADGGGEAAYRQLRQLLVGPELAALEELQHRLDDRGVRAEEVSQILAEALALRARRDSALQQTLHPLIEQAVRVSVARNPSILANTLFPIIGEAVRKAVAHALRGMMESMNQVLERSFSWQGIMWRVEALRTGKSIGEVALTRSLRYRVEEVFLIHRESGLLMCHVGREQNVMQDADLVSGMLTAVQDFVHDSFHSTAKQELETIELGKYNVWLQHGPSAHLAAVVTGTPPGELRTLLQRTLEQIHQELGPALATYDGDSSTMEAARPLLQACLVGQQSAVAPRRSRLWMFPVGAVIALIAILAGLSIRERMRWNDLTRSLRAEPGIVLTDAERSWGEYKLAGLRDPLSLDPEKLIAASGIDPAKVRTHWEPYVSLDPKFSTSRQAIQQKDEVERQLVRFAVNSARLAPDQEAKLDLIEVNVARLRRYAAATGQSVEIEVEGHTDPTGAEEHNALLSQQRAESVVQSLTDRGVGRELLKPIGVGSAMPAQSAESFLPELNRRVTFRVVISKKQP